MPEVRYFIGVVGDGWDEQEVSESRFWKHIEWTFGEKKTEHYRDQVESLLPYAHEGCGGVWFHKDNEGYDENGTPVFEGLYLRAEFVGFWNPENPPDKVVKVIRRPHKT